MPDDFYAAAKRAGNPSTGVLAGSGQASTEDAVFNLGPEIGAQRHDPASYLNKGGTMKVVKVPSIKRLVAKSPGFAKKGLSTYKLDLLALCGFGCTYCSSNKGNYLRANRERFADLAEDQVGDRLYPDTSGNVMYTWPDVISKLEMQISQRGPSFGEGHTLVFSMLTDGFSPLLVGDGTTEKALTLIMEGTRFRVRVLTKNAVVGSDRWIRFFQRWPGRFVVGLSLGTQDRSWAKMVEVGTSSPQARLKATKRLQDAGIPTFGMLCPVFPDAMSGGSLEALVDAINPQVCEHVWVEPYNDRGNWQTVRDGYVPGTSGYVWFDKVYGGPKRMDLWSRYATDLFFRVAAKARAEGWIHKLRYLLYEGDITAADAPDFGNLEGVLLQDPPNKDGTSRNPSIAALQSAGAS